MFLSPCLFYNVQMAANYNRPKPVDPVAYRGACTIRVRCVCGRQIADRLDHFAQMHRILPHTKLYELMARLRCRRCGARPSVSFDHRGPLI